MFKKFLAIKLFYCVAMVLVLAIIGCGTMANNILGKTEELKYVNNTTDNVVFMIRPFNYQLDQMEYAAEIQKAMIEVGLIVEEQKLGIKEIEKRKGAGLEQSGGVTDIGSAAINKSEAQAVLIEKYNIGEKDNADYYVDTIRSNYEGTVKFIRKSDNKVVGVANVWFNRGHVKNDLMPCLEKMNFVKKVHK